MRTMLKATMPVAKGNQAILDGSLPRILGETMEKLKPEAAYFTANNGQRCCIMVFDMQDSSQMPGIAEAFFMGLEADLEITPVMNFEDLQKGLAAAFPK